MTSDEIRKKELHFTGTVAEAQIQVELEKLKMLLEIAAQLADLNEHFRMVDGAVFGGVKPNAKEKSQEV